MPANEVSRRASQWGANPTDRVRVGPGLTTVPNLVTVGRLVLFGVFQGLLVGQHVAAALVMLLAAWLLDIVDGWLARRLGQVTELGSVLDKVIDRVVIVGGLFTLISVGLVPVSAVLIATKDISSIAVNLVALRQRQTIVSLGWLGKSTTALQGVALIWLVAGWPGTSALIAVIAGLGLAVGVKAWFTAPCPS